MPTPTETLEAFIVAFEVIYSAPEFSAVTAGADAGDVYIDTTMTVDSEDYTLRIDWRAAGDTEMPQWTITCTDPSGINLNQYLNETNDETDLLTAVQAYLTALDTAATNTAALVDEFVVI